jgi:hypothetical protein
MNWFWLNVPAMVVFFAAVTGIPLWLSFRHCDTGPVTLLVASYPADDVVAVAELEQELEAASELIDTL